MGGFCRILTVLFIIALQYAVVRRQISSGTVFFSFASPTPGYYRNGDFQAITSFKIPEKVQYGTKLESQVLHWAGGIWKVILYPCGKASPITAANDSDGFASIYLELNAGDSPKDVLFKCSLLSADGKDVVDERYCTEGHNFQLCRSSGFDIFVEQEYFTEPALECLNSEGNISIRVSLQDNDASIAILSLPLPPRGLRNLGNTCYMNAILQLYFHADTWRDALASSTQPKAPSTTWALRNIFSALSTSVDSSSRGGLGVETGSLVRTLGIDPTVQQDAQEFGCTLLQEVESEARGQRWSNVLEGRKAAFEGRLENYIECVNHRLVKKIWQEKFFDLSIDVKGRNNLNESLNALLTPELLTRENKWSTQEHGYQDARKGVRFVSLPRILQFHLKRFEYDPKTHTMVKVNSRFLFPTEIDMGLWCDTPDGCYKEGDAKCSAAHGKDLHYSLRSIVMHQGGLERGHYYTYIRRKRQDNDIRWFKLDDNRVSSVEESEALEDAFGHGERTWGGGLTCLRGILRPRNIVGHQSKASRPFKRDCNAYILQYHLNR